MPQILQAQTLPLDPTETRLPAQGGRRHQGRREGGGMGGHGKGVIMAGEGAVAGVPPAGRRGWQASGSRVGLSWAWGRVWACEIWTVGF